MPSCVVKCCKNNSMFQKKEHGITFHRFPVKNEPWKNDWVNIIRDCRCEKNWIPSNTSCICSIHFDAKDLHMTKRGYFRLIEYAIPKKFLDEPPNMTNIQPFNSNKAFETSWVAGVMAFEQPSSIKSSPPSSPSSKSQITSAAEVTKIIDFEQSLPVVKCHSPRKSQPLLLTPRFQNHLIRKENYIQKLKRKIKSLNQSVRRLQGRNKSLSGMLKNLRNHIKKR